MSKEDKHEQTLIKVSWALDKAYKIAVHQCGITDWSTEKPHRKNEVERMQIEIAKMILLELRQL